MCLVLQGFTVLILVFLRIHVLPGSMQVFVGSHLVKFVQLAITVLIQLSHLYLVHQALSVLLGALSVWLALLYITLTLILYNCLCYSLALKAPSVKLVKEGVLNVLLVTVATLAHLAIYRLLASLGSTVLEDKLSAYLAQKVLSVCYFYANVF